MPSTWATNAAKNTGLGLWGNVSHFVQVMFTVLWDGGLTLCNVVLPRKKSVPTQWPEYVPRTATDSRSPCPAINALANHGILPRDGRDIPFKQLAHEIHKVYNFAPSFAFFVTNFMAGILKRKWSTDTLDLSDLCVHNGIEYDGSITRYDTNQQPDQSIPATELINDLLASSKDGKKLTAADLSRVITVRRAHSKSVNAQFSLDGLHSFFSANNAASLLTAFGGEVADIKPFLLEERLPQGWTSKVRARMGGTMAMFNFPTLKILLGVDPSWQKSKKTV